VEYGLIIALVAVVVIVGLTLVGGKANTLFPTSATSDADARILTLRCRCAEEAVR
jgi:Flp pilus assembly pilin Flp